LAFLTERSAFEVGEVESLQAATKRTARGTAKNFFINYSKIVKR
jgi:hypothetical protein